MSSEAGHPFMVFKMFAVHNIFVPPAVRDPIMAADTFPWLGRETVAVATVNAVWIGWRRDSKCRSTLSTKIATDTQPAYRELIRFHIGSISAVSIIPDFGWLLVLLSSGSLLAFNLHEMVPTSDPSTWQLQGRSHGLALSTPELNVAFARVGVTKGRTLGE